MIYLFTVVILHTYMYIHTFFTGSHGYWDSTRKIWLDKKFLTFFIPRSTTRLNILCAGKNVSEYTIWLELTIVIRMLCFKVPMYVYFEM